MKGSCFSHEYKTFKPFACRSVRCVALSISGFIVLGQAVGPVNHSTPNGHLVTTKKEEYLAGKEYFYIIKIFQHLQIILQFHWSEIRKLIDLFLQPAFVY